MDNASARTNLLVRRSGAVGAALSFVFPGLGQLYHRRLAAALIFALPALLAIILLAGLLAGDVTSAALLLLDPAIALAATAAIVAFAAWRAVSVLQAWQIGRRTMPSRLLMYALVLVIAITHAFAASYTYALMEAGQRLFGEDIAFEPDVAFEPDYWAGGPPATAPAGQAEPTVTPGEQGTPLPQPTRSAGATDGAVDSGPPDSEEPEELDPADAEPTIEEGPPPNVEPHELDSADDGLLNVLLVGVDWTPSRQHALTDTMIVVSVNAKSGAVLMFSFPRDVAEFPLYHGGTYMGRLNSFANYARRNPERYPGGGMQALSRQIGFLLGVPIDHYAAVNIPGFRGLVETIGGVTVYNDRAISDSKNELFLPVGEHRLDAETALKYVRSRYGPGNSDFVRAGRQQQVLASLRREILSPRNAAQLPRVIDAISRVITTNFPPNQLDEVIGLAGMVDRDPTGRWVFGSPTWAVHPPLSETGGRWVIRLKVDRIAALSRDLFGKASLYGR